jgi:hypothetical protein
MDVIVAVIVIAGLLAAAADRWSWRLPLWTTLAIALGIRVVVAVLSRPLTPLDVADTFHTVGLEIVAGRDPTLSLAYHQWNFLPLMPFLFAALSKVDLAWVDAIKVPAIAADVGCVWLVGTLAPPALAAGRRLVYALHPVALLTTAFHGQVEPFALLFLLAGMVLYQRNRDLAAGAVFGIAITAKTWPLLVVLPIVWRQPRRILKLAIPAVVIAAAFFASSVVFLGSSPTDLASALSSYGSFAGFWGWAGMLRSFGDTSIFGYDTWVSLPGMALVVASVVISMYVFRHASMLRRAWVTPMASLAVSAAVGPQYLVWPVPMMTANGERQFAYSAASTFFMLVFYLWFIRVDEQASFLAGISFVVIATMLQMLWRAGRGELTRGSSDAVMTATTVDEPVAAIAAPA